MNTTNFFKTLFFAATTMLLIGTTSCVYIDKKEMDHQTEEEMERDREMMISSDIMISEDLVRLCDLKAVYKYNNKTIEEPITDMNLTQTFAPTEQGGKIDNYFSKEFTVKKKISTNCVNVTIKATPKSNAENIIANLGADKDINLVMKVDNHIDNSKHCHEQTKYNYYFGVEKDHVIDILDLGGFVFSNTLYQ